MVMENARTDNTQANIRRMVEIHRSNDIVLISFLQALLADAGIESIVFDSHASIIEGSIGALPRRLMVLNEDKAGAVAVLRESGYGERA